MKRLPFGPDAVQLGDVQPCHENSHQRVLDGQHLGLLATIIFFACIGFGIFGQCAGGGDMIEALLADKYFLSAHAKGVLNPICNHL